MSTPPVLLVVEDDPAQQKAYAAVGARFGFEILLTPRAGDVLRLALQHKPDAILLDMRVEDGDTLKVLHALRTSVETMEIPVTVVSAYLVPELKQHLRRFHRVPWLPKPWTIDELLGCIAGMR